MSCHVTEDVDTMVTFFQNFYQMHDYSLFSFDVSSGFIDRWDVFFMFEMSRSCIAEDTKIVFISQATVRETS